MLQAVLEDVEGDAVTVATVLAYPITDCVLLAVGVGALAGTGWRLDRTWALLAAGILAFWFADSMYLVSTAQGVYEAGGWFDAGWWAGLPLIAAAAWQTPPTRRVRCTGDSLRLLIAPLVSGAVGLELLVYASMGELNPLAVGLAAAALVFVMIRLTLTFRQNVGILRASRDEAMTDALTGLGNRRALTRELDDALAVAQPESPAGPRAVRPRRLQALQRHLRPPRRRRPARPTRRNLRAYFGNRARVFRMGGDEFCALFEPRGADPEMLLDGAALALSEQGDGFWIGCSYGSVSLPRETTDPPEALRIADQRMYAQKHAGRMSAGRQVKEALTVALAVRDPRLEAEARTLAESRRRPRARSASIATSARPSGSRPSCTRSAGSSPPRPRTSPWRASGSSPPRPSLAAVARLLRAIPDRDAPLGARIVAVAVFAAEHGTDALHKTDFDPAVVEAVTGAQPVAV